MPLSTSVSPKLFLTFSQRIIKKKWGVKEVRRDARHCARERVEEVDFDLN
jgi:hypothetical protein